jgi:predicted DNA-binding helix-hairpin-helix protein
MVVMCMGVVGWVYAAGRVDANTASFDLLQTVPGIGPNRAQHIVTERQRGLYKSLDDLQARIPGIGVKSVAKMAAAGLMVHSRCSRQSINFGQCRQCFARGDLSCQAVSREC